MKVYTVFFLVKNLRPLLLKNPNLSSPPYLSFRKASENSGESPVYRLAQEGKIPATKVGNQWRFQKKKIDEWLEKGGNLKKGSYYDQK